MPYWTVTGMGIEDIVQGKSFGISLDRVNSSWMAVGPDVEVFFKTKSGSFDFSVLPENGLQLQGSHSAEVAFFRGLNGLSSVGSTGNGRASETGVNFRWRLDSK